MSRKHFSLVLTIYLNGVELPAHITVCYVDIIGGSYTTNDIRHLISSNFSDFYKYVGSSNNFVLEIIGWLSQQNKPSGRIGNSVLVKSYDPSGKFGTSKLNTTKANRHGTSLKDVRYALFNRMYSISKKYGFNINTSRTNGQLKPISQHIDISKLGGLNFKPGNMFSVTYAISVI